MSSISQKRREIASALREVRRACQRCRRNGTAAGSQVCYLMRCWALGRKAHWDVIADYFDGFARQAAAAGYIGRAADYRTLANAAISRIGGGA